MSTHYNAFISYRHCELDSKVAADVQYQLEHMRIPKGLATRTGLTRIERIFRDKEELPITSDLNDDIADALANSDHLIVICSPRLKESIWCMREIDNFLKNHDRRQILTVLAEGEPYDVIPEILTKEVVTDPVTGEEKVVQVEPLSCDYRLPWKKARREEIPRLAAGILGCRYDDLRQRQKMYRQRQLMMAMATGLTVVTGFAGYAVNRSMVISEQARQIEEDYLETLRSQSIYLSNQASQALADSDTKTGIQLALAALPSEENDRPWTAEAEAALTQGLYLYTNSTEYYQTENKYYGYGKVSNFCMSKDYRYLALLDDQDYVSVFDTTSGSRLWDRYMGDGGYLDILVTDENTLVVGGSSIFTGIGLRGYDLLTGQPIWGDMEAAEGGQGDQATPHLGPIKIPDRWGDETSFLVSDMRYVRDTNDIIARDSSSILRVDASTGQVIWQQTYDLGEEQHIIAFPASIDGGIRERIALLITYGVGDSQRNEVGILDLEDGSLQILPGSYPSLISARIKGDKVVVMSFAAYSDPYDIKLFERQACITQIDLTTGQKDWEATVPKFNHESDGLLSSFGNGDYLVVLGKTLVRLDSRTGEVIARIETDSRVLNGSSLASGNLLLYTRDGGSYNYHVDENRVYPSQYMNLSGPYQTVIRENNSNRYFILPENCSAVHQEQNIAHDMDYTRFLLSEEAGEQCWGAFLMDHYMIVVASNGISCMDLDTDRELWYQPYGEKKLSSGWDWYVSDDQSTAYICYNKDVCVIRPEDGGFLQYRADTERNWGNLNLNYQYFAEDAGLTYVNQRTDGVVTTTEFFLETYDPVSGTCSERAIPEEIEAALLEANAKETETIFIDNVGTMSRFGRYLLFSTGNGGTAYVMDLEGDGYVRLAAPVDNDSSFCIDPVSGRMAVSTRNLLYLMNPAGEVVGSTQLNYDSTSFTFVRDGQVLLLTDKRNFLRVFGGEDCQLKASYSLSDPFTPNMAGSPYRWQVLPDGSVLCFYSYYMAILEPEQYKVRTTAHAKAFGIYDNRLMTICYENGGSGVCYYPIRSTAELRALGEAAVAGQTLHDPEKYGLD